MNWESRPNSHNRNLRRRHAATVRNRRPRWSVSKRLRAITIISRSTRWIQSTHRTRTANRMSQMTEQETMARYWQAIHQSHCELRHPLRISLVRCWFLLVPIFLPGPAVESESCQPTAQSPAAPREVRQIDHFHQRPTTTLKAIALWSWNGWVNHAWTVDVISSFSLFNVSWEGKSNWDRFSGGGSMVSSRLLNQKYWPRSFLDLSPVTV